MDDMAHNADHALAKQPGIMGLNVTRRRHRASLHHHAGKPTRSWRPKGPETRGTTACCIRSKSSRFYAHPFREGNGRAQRVFWSRVARDAGWHLDWRRVSAERNNEASRAAMERSDLRPLREMFDAITTARRPRERGTPRAALDAARLAFGAPATEATRTTPTTFEAGTRRLPPGRMSDRSPGIGD